MRVTSTPTARPERYEHIYLNDNFYALGVVLEVWKRSSGCRCCHFIFWWRTIGGVVRLARENHSDAGRDPIDHRSRMRTDGKILRLSEGSDGFAGWTISWSETSAQILDNDEPFFLSGSGAQRLRHVVVRRWQSPAAPAGRYSASAAERHEQSLLT